MGTRILSLGDDLITKPGVRKVVTCLTVWPWATGTSEVNGADEGLEGPPVMFICHNSPGSLPHGSVAAEEVERTPLMPEIEFPWHPSRLESQSQFSFGLKD